MGDFGTRYAQRIILSISTFVGVIIIGAILLITTPYYLNWTAGKSVQRSEMLGMAELAKGSQEALLVIEKAQAEVVAMGILSRGQQSAARAKAEYIKIVGDEAKRYQDYAKDEYLLAMAKSLNNGDIDTVNLDSTTITNP
jgi:hypothetical protein